MQVNPQNVVSLTLFKISKLFLSFEPGFKFLDLQLHSFWIHTIAAWNLLRDDTGLHQIFMARK